MDWKESLISEVNKIFVTNPYPTINEYIKVGFRVIKNNPIKKAWIRAVIDGGGKYIRMNIEKETKNFVYYFGWLKVSQKWINYHFILDLGSEVLFFSKKGVFTHIPTEDYDFVIIADFENPEWVPKSVFYQVFPDRFNNGDTESDVKTGEYSFDGFTAQKREWGAPPLEYHEGGCLDFYGGDLKGIEDKIDYFKKLGVNAIYINPIFEAKTHHRYDCIDYFKVDPHLGGDKALKSLVDKLHENNMKIIVDVSINHTSVEHKWFKTGISDPNSEERGFYYFDKNNNYRSWAGVKTLPQLNYNSKKLREIIFEGEDSLVRYYIKHFDIDGWRFDVANDTGRNGLDQFGNEIFQKIRTSVKSIKKNAYLIGEHWEDNISYLLGDQLDGCMNYFVSSRPLRSFAGEVDWFLKNIIERGRKIRSYTGNELKDSIEQHYSRLPNQVSFLQFNLLDSHDMPRFHNSEFFRYELYKGIVIILFLLPGTTSIYYGDEIKINGHSRSVEGCRYPMEWNEDKWDKDFFGLYQTLSHLKLREEALQTGCYKSLYADNETYVLSRFDEKKAFIGIITKNTETKSVTIPVYPAGVFDSEGEEIFSKEKFKAQNGLLKINLNKYDQKLIVFETDN